MRRDVGQRAKPGSGDHRSETGGRYIDIGISQVVIFFYLYLILSYQPPFIAFHLNPIVSFAICPQCDYPIIKQQ